MIMTNLETTLTAGPAMGNTGDPAATPASMSGGDGDCESIESFGIDSESETGLITGAASE